MKRLLSVLLLISFYQHLACQVNDIESFTGNSYDRNSIKKNKIDTVYAIRQQGEESITFVFCFNLAGNLKYAFDMNQAGTDGNAYEYKYSPDGKLHSLVHYKVTENSEKVVDSIAYIYGKTGLREKAIKTILPEGKAVTIYSYTNQKLTEETTEMLDNKIITRYTYNNKAQKSISTSLFLEGKSKTETIISRQSFQYDASNRLSTSIDSAVSSFAMSYTTKYLYNPQTALIAIEKTDGSYSHYSYDKQGMLEEREYSLPDLLRTGNFSGTESYAYAKRK